MRSLYPKISRETLIPILLEVLLNKNPQIFLTKDINYNILVDWKHELLKIKSPIQDWSKLQKNPKAATEDW